MTDKILVQQLQKELVRMENELRKFAPNTVLLERELLIKQMDEEIKELTRQRDIFQSRVETLLQSGKHQFLRSDKDSNPGVSSNLHPDQDLDSGSSSENPDRPISGVVKNNEDHVRRRENREPKVQLDIYSPIFVGPDSDPGWDRDAIADRASAESEDSCTEVRCIEIEEVKTVHQTDVSSSFHVSEEGDMRPALNGDAESSTGRRDGKPNHVAEDDSPDALKQKILELQRTIDRLDGLSEKSNGSSESSLAISRSVPLPFNRSKSCRPTLAATSSLCNKVDQESVSHAQVNEPGRKACPQFNNLELKTVSPFQFNKLDQKSEPPPKFYEPNVLYSKLATLEQETNASAARVEKECSTTSVCFEDKLSEPLLHAKKRKSTRNHSRTRQLNTLSEGESVMDADAEDNASVLNFVVEMKTGSKETPLKKDFDDLMVMMAKAWGFNDLTDRAKRIDMPNYMLPYKFEGLQRYIIELWHPCHVSLVHRSCSLLLLKGEFPDSIYLYSEIRRLCCIKDAFSSGNKFLGDGRRNISPDSSLKAINRERKMLSKQLMRGEST